jgi:hypothetical protein
MTNMSMSPFCVQNFLMEKIWYTIYVGQYLDPDDLKSRIWIRGKNSPQQVWLKNHLSEVSTSVKLTDFSGTTHNSSNCERNRKT